MTAASLRLWGWPLALGVLTTTGLITALVSDAWGDVWSWVALGVPVLVMAWYGLRRTSATPKPAASSSASPGSTRNSKATR